MSFVVIANRIKVGIIVAISLVMVYALVVSREHVTEVAHWLGVPGWQAETAFILVDLPALIGKVLQVKYFAHSTRKVGTRLTYLSGGISLACNIGAGLILGSYGAAGWGAFVVVMFLVLESVIVKIRPAAAVTRAKNAANGTAQPASTTAEPTARQLAARKGAETRKRNAAAQISPGRVPLAELNASMAE
jgi:hypothetical protein